MCKFTKSVFENEIIDFFSWNRFLLYIYNKLIKSFFRREILINNHENKSYLQ